MSRRISKLGHILRLKFGVEIEFARVEFTIKAEEGTHTFHPHTHLIVMPLRRLTRARWRAVLTFCHSYLGTHFRDCGRIRDAAEACKYMTKIDDSDEGEGTGLLSLSAAELAELARQLHGRQLSRRMGIFAKECRDRQTRGVKVRKTPDEQGVWRWAEVAKAKVEARQKANGSGVSSNIVIGRTACTFRRPVLESALLVLNYDGDYESLIRSRFNGDEDAAFGAIKVHTRTRIVQAQGGGWAAQIASAAHGPP
jgi:hypothetical protein